ncbi:hypothetical protein MKX03_026732, partial [Papaver bracteatum]
HKGSKNKQLVPSPMKNRLEGAESAESIPTDKNCMLRSYTSLTPTAQSEIVAET